LPDGYLLRANGGERVPLVSRHLPLGVLEPAAFNDRYEVFPLELGDRVFLLSDGVLEACNQQGELFGERRLLRVFSTNRQPAHLFAEIQQALLHFRGELQDDVSLVEVSMVEEGSLNRGPLIFTGSGQNSPLDWSASFEFRGETLRRFNPLPFLLQLLLEVEGLRPQAGALYSVLAELYSNALEHGVLGLDSSLKCDAEGFAEYYRQRSTRLAQIREGYVRFHLQLVPEPAGGRLTVRVEDSGPGFDGQAILQQQLRVDRLCGRGLALVRQLSERCTWPEDGQGVSVEFSWLAGA
jgi:signal transduction histidine kinase